MLPAAYIIAAIVVLLGACLFYFRNTSLRQRSWDLKYSEEVSILLASLEGLNPAFSRLTAFESGYLNNTKCSEWCREADQIIDALSKVPRLKKALSRKQVSLIVAFKALRSSIQVHRTHFNSQFLKEELKLREHYFNYLLANPLDENQRKSIVTDEDCNLIIAGAGCGKTTTIEGKVKYIIDRYGVKEEEIVLLSFTAKSAEEMRERINRRHGLNITASTFHSLGLDIIGLATGEKPSVMEERACWDIVRNAFHEKRSDNRYLTMLNEFFMSYLKIPPEQESISNQDELRNYLKGNDVVSLKNIEVAYNGKKTLERQYCKSFEEVRIANFLYLNGLKYQYEPDYEHRTATAEFRQYQPDFYLPEHGIYIEHYGIDEQGNVPRWFGNGHNGSFNEALYRERNKSYNEKILWADEIHQKYNTRLIKTFSWENKNGTLLSDLQQKLEANGVALNPLSPSQVWAEIVQNAEKDVTDFEMLLMTFLNLYKSNNCAMPELFKKASGLRKQFDKERATAFLKLFEPILLTYQESLAARKRIDFNDMINLAASQIAAGRFPKKVRYLIVDEFQDLSFGRYHLLKAIQEANPGCKLFCVGDDWQSIFRFAGSDISLFTRFEEYFGVTERSVIGNTYRFNQELIDLTTAFVQENPAQIKKKIYSQSAYRGKSVEVLKSFSSRPERDIKPIVKALEYIRDEVLSSKLSPEKVKVLVLARYNHDCKMLAEAGESFKVIKKANDKTAITFLPYPHLHIEFMTMHRAKGLEADYVIVLNCNAGKYGIPSEQADDPLLNIVLSQADQFPNGEERRLFYVALTRTKRKVYLISSARNASRFVHELEPRIKKMYGVERDDLKR